GAGQSGRGLSGGHLACSPTMSPSRLRTARAGHSNRGNARNSTPCTAFRGARGRALLAPRRLIRDDYRAGIAFALPSRTPLPPIPAWGRHRCRIFDSRSSTVKLATLEDLFVKELRDLYSAEKQIIKALPKMVKSAHSQMLQNALNDHLEVTKEQAKRLEQIFE